MGSSCYSRGNRDNLERIRSFLEEHQLQTQLLLKGCRCGGCCSVGPNIWIGDRLHQGVTEDKLDEFLENLAKVKLWQG